MLFRSVARPATRASEGKTAAARLQEPLAAAVAQATVARGPAASRARRVPPAAAASARRRDACVRSCRCEGSAATAGTNDEQQEVMTIARRHRPHQAGAGRTLPALKAFGGGRPGSLAPRREQTYGSRGHPEQQDFSIKCTSWPLLRTSTSSWACSPSRKKWPSSTSACSLTGALCLVGLRQEPTIKRRTSLRKLRAISSSKRTRPTRLAASRRRQDSWRRLTASRA